MHLEVLILDTCFSGINEKWYKNSWKEFDQLKNVDAKYYASDYYDVNVKKTRLKQEHH